MLKAEAVNRRPSKLRPTPQLLQAETHAVAPPGRDPPIGFDENRREKRKKNGENREERESRGKKWRREKKNGANERERKKKKD